MVRLDSSIQLATVEVEVMVVLVPVVQELHKLPVEPGVTEELGEPVLFLLPGEFLSILQFMGEAVPVVLAVQVVLVD